MKYTSKLLKIIALIFAVIFLISACSIRDENNPEVIARVAVLSDVHFGREVEPSSEEKFISALDQINEIFENKTDAVIMAGDQTYSATDEEYDAYMRVFKEHTLKDTVIINVMGNHEYYRYGYNQAGIRENQIKSREAYTEKVGPLESDTVIAGIHFIGISPRDGFGDYRQPTKYLYDHVNAAKKENPKAPIFVINHEGLGNEHNYSCWGTRFDRYLDRILLGTPQLISLSGHTHYALDDPKMIIQKDITAISTSTVGEVFCAYRDEAVLEFPDGKGASQGILLYIYDNYDVRAVRYDFTNKCKIGQDWIIETSKNIESRDNYKYTLEGRQAQAKAPVFEDTASVAFSEITENGAKISFPIAHIYDEVSDDMIYKYYVTVKQGNTVVSETSFLADYYLNIKRKQVQTSVLENLQPSTAYSVSITAEGPWKNLSKPLTATFTTKASHVK